MSYTEKKITQEEINAHHVQGATDYLIGNAQQNKAVFDNLPEFIAGKHNELIDELNSQHGDEIQAAVNEWLAEHPEATTTVQNDSLTTAKYKDGSVTEVKIANGAITPSKLDREYSTPSELAAVNAALANEMSVLDARMDTFSSLPEGSTSGNAELLDIRVGADSVTYTSAGDAVRIQSSNLGKDVARLDNLSYKIDDFSAPIQWFERGSITDGNNSSYREGSRARSKSIMSFDTITALTITSGDFGIFYYHNDGTFDRWGGWKTNADIITLPKGQKFRLMITLDRNASASRVDTLADMVSILRFYTDKNQPNVLLPYNMEFEHGSLESGEDSTYNGGARIRNKKIMQYPYSLGISMRSGTYSIHFYHEDDSFAYRLAWRTTEEYIIPPHAKFRMVLAETASATAYSKIQPLLDDLKVRPMGYEKSLSPNVIYQCRNVDETVFPPYSKWYIQAAAQNQYDRVRFNVRKTTDGHYFLCHDDTINSEARNPDGSEISEQIRANGRTLAELNSYDWGIKYGSYYAGATVPLLEDALLYSAMFNLGVSIEFSSLTGWTDEDTNNVLTMFDKYGATDNLIVIDPQGMNFTFLRKFIAHNERISCYVAGPEANFTASAIASTDELKTNYNKVYVQLYPWGTVPTDTFIALAKQHGWVLYNSFLVSKSALLQIDNYQKGYGLIEAANVFAIKDTIRAWVNSIVDA